jgi:hypothetical protein
MPEDNVAQENVTVNLPADCIYEIFQYIHDLKTLYSCITLNQIFCQVTVRILWSNPFKYTQDKDKKSIIFRTYFSCLDDHEKEQITTFFNKSVTVSDFPKPFINYPSYLQEFEVAEIQKSMRIFLRQYYPVVPTENRINSIVRILNPFMEKLLFNDQNNIRYVSVDLNDYQISIEKNHIDVSSFDSEVLEQVLSNINKFSFGFNFDYNLKKMEFLKFIQRNAEILVDVISDCNRDIQHVRFSFASPYIREYGIQKLRKLNMEYDKLLDILKSLILSLNNLKSLEIPCFLRNMEFANLFRKHSHSLTYLRLDEIFSCSIVLRILDHCSNLETIELVRFCFTNNSDIYSISIYDKPITSSLNNLKNLYITATYTPVVKLFERIILMSNNNLQTLFYDKQIHDFNNITPSIRTLCTNLTHLYIRIVNESEISNTISFLKNLQYLVHLKLSCDTHLKDDNIIRLARSFSPSLQILEIITMMENLQNLIQNMQCNLRELRIDGRISDVLLRSVMDYSRQRNSLIMFRYLNKSYYSLYSMPSTQVLEEARELFKVEVNPDPSIKGFVKSIF